MPSPTSRALVHAFATALALCILAIPRGTLSQPFEANPSPSAAFGTWVGGAFEGDLGYDGNTDHVETDGGPALFGD